MRSFSVDVEPAVLVWARRTAHLSVEDAAKRLGVSTADVHTWEEGASDPIFAKLTFSRLMDVARVYGRPFAVFLLDSPPTDFIVPKDFRRLPEGERQEWSPDLSFELRRIASQRLVALELANLSGEHPVPIEIKVNRTDNYEVVSERIRKWLNVDANDRSRWSKDPFAFWSERIEEKGILVAQLWGIPLEEVRGCSISEQPSPIVAVNVQDSKGGRAFTLLHELTRVLLDDGGVCSLDDRPASSGQEIPKVEQFCNRVAAALLMPRSTVLSDPVVDQALSPADWTDPTLQKLSRRYGVSAETALLRLASLGRASQDDYWSRRPGFLQDYADIRELRIANRHTEGGVPPAQRRLAELGRRFVTEAVGAYERRDITGSDLSEYLDMKMDYLPALRRLLREHA